MDFGSCVTWRSKFVWCFLGTFLDQYNSNLNLRGAGSVYNDVNCDAKLSCRMGLQSQRQYRLTIFKSTFTSFCWYHLLELQVWIHGFGLQFKSSWLRSLAVTGKTHIGLFSPKISQKFATLDHLDFVNRIVSTVAIAFFSDELVVIQVSHLRFDGFHLVAFFCFCVTCLTTISLPRKKR